MDGSCATPLHVAVQAGSDAVVCLLRNQVNAFDSDSNTPLHYAAQHGQLEIAKKLLEYIRAHK